MKMLCKLVIISALVMTAAFPAMAQQDQQQAPMMGQGQGGMMGQGQGGMMGQGQGGMMGQDGMMGQGGMMGRGGMMGQDMGAQDMSGCPMMGDMMGFGRRGMKEGMGHGAMMHSVPMMEGRLAYIKADLAITDAQMAACQGAARDDGRHARRHDESQRERQRFGAHGCPHQNNGEQAREPQGAQARDRRSLRCP